MVYEGGTDQLHAIPMMELAINNSIQDGTGLSPTHIVYGAPIRTPVDMLDGVQGGTAGVWEVWKMQEIQDLVHKRLMHTQKAKKRQSDRHYRDVEYTMGLKVLLSTKNLRLKVPRKLQDWYMEPFEVLKRVGPAAYNLYLSHSSALKTINLVFNVSLLKDFVDNGLRWQPPLIEVDGQQECQIEGIVGHRTFGGQPQYFVSFVNCDASENFWLAEEQLSNAKDLLPEYQLVHGL